MDIQKFRDSLLQAEFNEILNHRSASAWAMELANISRNILIEFSDSDQALDMTYSLLKLQNLFTQLATLQSDADREAIQYLNKKVETLEYEVKEKDSLIDNYKFIVGLKGELSPETVEAKPEESEVIQEDEAGQEGEQS